MGIDGRDAKVMLRVVFNVGMSGLLICMGLKVDSQLEWVLMGIDGHDAKVMLRVVVF